MTPKNEIWMKSSDFHTGIRIVTSEIQYFYHF